MTYPEDRVRAAATIARLITTGAYPEDLWNQ